MDTEIAKGSLNKKRPLPAGRDTCTTMPMTMIMGITTDIIMSIIMGIATDIITDITMGIIMGIITITITREAATRRRWPSPWPLPSALWRSNLSADC